jgi:hypothetical protein
VRTNIQFYAQRSDLSEQVGLDGAWQCVGNDLLVRKKLGPLRERLTFHSELRAGAPIEITMSTLELIAGSWGIACSTNRKNRMLPVPDLNLSIGLRCTANPFDRRSHRGAQSASTAI